MATKKVNIDIVAKDKSQQALNKVRGSLDRVKQSVFNVRNALAGLGAGLVIRNLVNTGKELENLQVRLKFLLKDTNEGAKAFDNMVKFASKVPFSLEEIQAGSGILATVTDNADDLQKMLEITGNVAAVTGLDFRTASEQIQRSFSAGIGAADLFREKGVRNMLGFKAGATVSIEETVEAFEKVFGSGGRFGQATDELANTFEGTLSMIGDKFFSFKKDILEAGFFPELKKQFGDLDKFLQENSETLEDIAKTLGEGLANAVVGLAESVKIVAENFQLLKAAVGGFIAFKLSMTVLKIASALRQMFLTLTGITALTGPRGLGLVATAIGTMTTAALLLPDPLEKSFEEFKKLTKPELKNKINSITEEIKKLEEENKKLEESLKEMTPELELPELENFDDLKNFKDEIVEVPDLFDGATDSMLKNSETIAKLKAELELLNQILNANAVATDEVVKSNASLATLGEFIDKIKNTKSDGNLDFLKETIDGLKKEIEEEEKKNAKIKAILEKNKIDSIKIFHDQQAEREKIYNTTKINEINAEIAHFQHMKKIHEEYARSRIEGEKALEDQKARIRQEAQDHTISESRAALEILSGMNKTAFRAFKAVRIAEATVNTYTAAAEAFKRFGGFPFGAIAAAATVAKGLALVAQIKSTSFREKGGPVSQGKPFIVGEKGPEMFVPNQSGNIISNDKMGMGGVVNVNFTINAVDTRGFRALLTNERGTIVNLINQAVTDKGRPVLV